MNYTYFVDISSWYFISFAMALILSSIVGSFLRWLNSEKTQLRKKISNLHSFGKTVRQLLNPKKIYRALKYKRTVDGFSNAVNSVQSTVSLMAIIFGIMPFMVAAFHCMLPSIAMFWCWILASIVSYIVCNLLMLPVQYYMDFGIEKRYGFSNTTMKIFVTDRLKESAFGIMMLVVIQSMLAWILGMVGDSSIVGVVILVSSLVAVGKILQWAMINLIMPLFNKFTPLEDGELKDKIEKLCNRCGFKLASIEVMDESRRSNHANAFVCGSFGKKKIVLFDTLVKNMTIDEVVAVVAHEIGHTKLHHLLIKNVMTIAMMTAYTSVIFVLMNIPEFYQAFGYSWVNQGNVSENYIIGLGLAGTFIAAFSWVLAPLSNWISRKMEYAADSYAAEHSKGWKHMANALVKLASDNLSDVFPHPVYEFVNYSHPSLVHRLEALKTHDR